MILITGDSGFIASYLTRQLVLGGQTIYGIDINPLKKGDTVYGSITGDILDAEALRKVPDTVDTIIHLAAAHKDFGISKEEYYRVNVDGMRSLLRFATERGIRRIIFYSTVAVYGDNQPSNEDTEPVPVNHYGGSKLQAEQVLKEWSKENPQREVTVIRPTVVFGPLNVANIFKLIKQVCDGKFIWVGDGRNIKSVAYVENLVEATIFLEKRMVPGFSVFNYSDEPHLEMRQLVEIIAHASGKRVPSFHFPLSVVLTAAAVIDLIGSITGHDFPITAARIRKFNTSTEHRSEKIRKLGFRPSRSIHEGINKNIQWYLGNRDSAAAQLESGSE